MSNISRRQFLETGVTAWGGSTLGLLFSSFLRNQLSGAVNTSNASGDYGPLVEAVDETTGLPLLKLPRGFRYKTFGWTGDEMSDGRPTPPAHDGMAIIATNMVEGKPQYTLCRNHEVNGTGDPIGAPEESFDKKSPGGCTNLVVDGSSGELLKSYVSLSGTSRNCAGGTTPWGTWLSCEETVVAPGDELYGQIHDVERNHGWIFEVGREGNKSPQPLKDMGRFWHEAVAVDPATGIVYETEDRDTSGIYRFLPNVKGQLAQGGNLQMMKLCCAPDVSTGTNGQTCFDVAWVDIEDPRRAHTPGTRDSLGVFQQGKAREGTTFARLEGCFGFEDRIYIVSTSGGVAKCGQVWEYHPRCEQMRLVFESPSKEILDYPDNIAVSPRGGLVLCEDSDQKVQHIYGMSRTGQHFPFAANNVVLNNEKNGFQGDFRNQEWAGAGFSPNGKWMFVNVQTPGFTVAITGPWEQGLL